MKRTYAVEARDKKSGLTLGELRTFVQSLDVQSVSDEAEVKVRINFGGTLKSVTVTEDPPPTITVDPPAPGTNPWN